MSSDILLTLKIFEQDASDERMDKLTSSLIQQLRELDLEKLERDFYNKIPDGVKGDPITVGAVILGLSTAVLPNLVMFLQNWVGDRRKIVIEAPNGAKIEFVPDKKLSTNEILALTEKLNRITPKK
jgi:hypothetical protein